MTIHRRRCSNVVAVAVLITGSAVGISGLYIMEEVRKVPVQRLAGNIQRRIADRPDDITLRVNLARLYAMAYALKVTEVDTVTRKGTVEPFFGHQVPNIPGPVRPAMSREHQERARADLARALQAYSDVVSRAPEHAIARLGYAWALEQSGQVDKAIEQYRRAVELAWPTDRKEDAFWVDPVTIEAAHRLTALLDPVKDAKELAALEQKAAALEAKGRMITPIAVPIHGPAEPPVDLSARVLFDADGSGIPHHWTWIRRDAAWLVYDADGSGRITSALQWFGNVTFWLFWENGYDALGALDDNGDGELRGSELRNLALWTDANGNGISEPGEVRPLSAHGIVALSCASVPGDGLLVAAHSARGVTFDDGKTLPSYDVILRRSARLTRNGDPHRFNWSWFHVAARGHACVPSRTRSGLQHTEISCSARPQLDQFLN